MFGKVGKVIGSGIVVSLMLTLFVASAVQAQTVRTSTLDTRIDRFLGDGQQTKELLGVSYKVHLTENDTVTQSYDREVIMVDSTIDSADITLSEGDTTVGNVVRILDVGGNASSNRISISTEGNATINGNATNDLTTDYASVTLIADGSDWYILD